MRAAAALAVVAFVAQFASAGAAAVDRVGVRGGKRAPDFSVRTILGKSFRLSAHRGRVVVLDFLVPGCGECEIEAPSLERAARRFGSRRVTVLVLDVSGIGDRDLRSYYLGAAGLSRVQVAGDKGFRVARTYGAHTLGETIVIGRDQTIRWHGSWAGNEKRLLREIGRALS